MVMAPFIFAKPAVADFGAGRGPIRFLFYRLTFIEDHHHGLGMSSSSLLLR